MKFLTLSGLGGLEFRVFRVQSLAFIGLLEVLELRGEVLQKV